MTSVRRAVLFGCACMASIAADAFLSCGGARLTEDAGTDAPTGADSQPIVDAGTPTPLSIFGRHLSFWLDGDYLPSVRLGSDGVQEWKDRSPNNLTTQAKFNKANDLVWLDAAVNGRGAIRFTGDRVDAAVLDGVLPLYDLGVGYMLIFVAAYSNPPGHPAAFFFANLPGQSLYFVANSCSDSRVFGGPSLMASDRFGCADGGVGVWSESSGWNDGKPHVFSLRAEAATSTIHIRIDGKETSGVSSFTSTSSAALGGHPHCC